MKRHPLILVLVLAFSGVALAAMYDRISLSVSPDGTPSSGVYVMNGQQQTLTFSSCTRLTSGSTYDEQAALGRDAVYSCSATNATNGQLVSSSWSVGYRTSDYFGSPDSNAQKNSGAVTATETTRAAAQISTSLIATRISAIMAPQPRAAGKAPAGPAPAPGREGGGREGAGQSAPSSGLPGGLSGQRASGLASDRAAGLSPEAAVSPPSGLAPARAAQAAVPAQDPLSGLTRASRLFSFDQTTLSGVLNPSTGLAAGGDEPRHGLWGTGSLANMQDFATSTRYEGNMYMFLGGYDYKLTEDLLVGAAAGYENTYLRTDFNQGSSGSDGYTVSPYAAYKFSETTTADLMAAVTFLDYDTRRAEVSGRYQAVRSMWSLNLNQYLVFDDWMISGVLGNMYANEHAESFSESDGTGNGGRENYVGELRAGTKVTYAYKDLEVQGGLAYLYDYMLRYTGTMPDQDAFEGSLGLSYRPGPGWLVGVEGVNSFDRAHTQNLRCMANLRYEF